MLATVLPSPSARAQELADAMVAFMRNSVLRGEPTYLAQRRVAGPDDHEVPGVIEELKDKARGPEACRTCFCLPSRG